MFDTGLIEIFRGDDTDGLGYQTINGVVDTDIDLTGCTLTFRYLDFTQTFTDVSSGDTLTITMSSSVTKTFPPGLGFASVRVTDSQGKLRTFNNRIPVIVKTSTPCVGGGSFHICFKKFPELEPLKIFTGGTSYTEYTGYVQRIIDKATATQYGLAMLYDGYDSSEGASTGKAASPAAVKAAYDAVIANLTDNYYTAQETEQAIDRLAAYYITSNASGDAFATRAALVGATTYYSGGAVRVPTRNDYAVVLADETHDGSEWRYIYSGSQWEPQYPIETNDYEALSNKPSINGKTLTGAVTLTGADIAVSGLDATKLDAALAAKYVKPANGIPASDLASGVIPTVPSASDATPAMDGAASAGSSAAFARGDHVHPSDTSKANASDLAAKANRTELCGAWAANTAYTTTSFVIHENAIYRCTEAHTSGAAWDSTKWTSATIADVLAQYLPKSGGTMTGNLTIDNSNGTGKLILGNENVSPGKTTLDPDLVTYGNNTIRTAWSNIVTTANGNSTAYAKPAQLGIAPWSASTSYSLGDIVAYNGATYRCTTAHTSGSAWDATKWTDDAVAVNSQIPTATSDLTNDSGYVTRYSQSAVTVAAGTTALTFSDRTANRYDITALTTETVAVTLPTITSGKVADVVVTLVVGADVPTFDWDTTTNTFIPGDSDWATLTASKKNILTFTSTGVANEWIVGRITEA